MSGKKYDVFLSHHSADKPLVERLVQKLHAQGINPFLDKWHLIPGDPWMEGLEKALKDSETCAVFFGPHGPGTWENEEMRVVLDYRVRNCMSRVFAVFLPGTPILERGDLPAFLNLYTWVDFRSGLEDPESFRRLLCGIRGEEPGPPHSRTESPIRPDRPPYLGLHSFGPEDADLFYGRTTLTDFLIERLHRAHFLALLGPSGSGKSSLVYAGLIPALGKGALLGSATWKIVPVKPGRSPLNDLAGRLLEFVVSHEDSFADKQDDLAMAMYKDGWTLAAEVQRHSLPHVLIVVDQCEAIFTQGSSDLDRQAFFSNLLNASGLTEAKVSVVLVLRADFYPYLDAYPELADRIATRQVHVTSLQENDLHQAIIRPAEQAGLRFEEG